MKRINLKLHAEKLKISLALFLCLIIFLFLNNISAKNIFDFGVSLYNESDYYRAISEFYRYLFYFPQGKKVNDAYLYIVKSYYFAEQYTQSINSAQKFLGFVKDESYKNRLYFYLATSYLRNENFDKSYKIYNILAEKIKPEKINECSFYRLGWVYILQTKWQKAMEKFEEFETKFPESHLVYESQLIRKELENGINFTPLSPTFAGIISAIIPGAGQVYCKRLGDGIVAFLLVGALAYSSYYYYKNGPSEMFYGSLFFNVLFYFGNIYTAYGSAHKYNKNFNLRLKEKLFNNFYEDYEF